jgi:general secretion pathway protein M
MQRIQALLVRFPRAAAAAYLALVAIFVLSTGSGVIDVLQRRAAVAESSEVLEKMQARDPARTQAQKSVVGVPSGSPFLEGTTASVAGAALLERLTSATKRANGNTLSSQVDLNGSRSKPGFIAATSSLEIEPASLQPLLYDLEAGMPFLFVDELVVQAPTRNTSEGGKLRVQLGVSGRWRNSK